ncbi:hypothetical protein CWI39_0360p0030, partial [Hamiltosporidium magnivora]
FIKFKQEILLLKNICEFKEGMKMIDFEYIKFLGIQEAKGLSDEGDDLKKY